MLPTRHWEIARELSTFYSLKVNITWDLQRGDEAEAQAKAEELLEAVHRFAKVK